MLKYFLWGLFLGGLALAADIMTKSYVYHEIAPLTQGVWGYPSRIEVWNNFLGIDFSVVHATNKGAAWGSLSGYQIPLLIMRIILIIGLCVYLIFFNKQKYTIIPLFLLIAGALGNVIDFFIYGEVIDMFKFVFWGYHYPIFNVADCSITIGIAWLLIASFLHDDTKTRTE